VEWAGREGGREGGRVGGARTCERRRRRIPQGGREEGRQEEREGGREAGRERGREGGREGGRAYLIDFADVDLKDGALNLLIMLAKEVEEQVAHAHVLFQEGLREEGREGGR